MDPPLHLTRSINLSLSVYSSIPKLFSVMNVNVKAYALRRKSICMDTNMEKTMACTMASAKICVCTPLVCNGVCVWLCLYAQRAVNFPPSHCRPAYHSYQLFPFSSTCFPKCWNVWRAAVIIRTLVAESNIFSDQFWELPCFFFHDFAILCIAQSRILLNQKEWLEKVHEVTPMRDMPIH